MWYVQQKIKDLVDNYNKVLQNVIPHIPHSSKSDTYRHIQYTTFIPQNYKNEKYWKKFI